MIASLIRSDLRNFKPYSSARSLYPSSACGASQKGILLDANENSLGSVIAMDLDSELNRYPDPYSLNLRKALGRFLDISEKNIFVGNGSDEAIDLLIRLFVERDKEIMVMEPTYGMYKVAAEVAGVGVKSCELTKDFQVNVNNILKQVSSKTKLIFCCSPNNPTGTLIPLKELEKLCQSFKGMVVVDEAYIEFASVASLAKNVLRLENLVVLRTFSKAWGLAGIRVGYAVAQDLVIKWLNKIKPPYNLNRLSSKLAIQALSQYSKMLELRKVIITERKKLSRDLTKLGFKVFPSEANFLLLYYPGASAIAKRLAEDNGIILRDFSSKPMLKDCLRVSVGILEQNRSLIAALSKII